MILEEAEVDDRWLIMFSLLLSLVHLKCQHIHMVCFLPKDLCLYKIPSPFHLFNAFTLLYFASHHNCHRSITLNPTLMRLSAFEHLPLYYCLLLISYSSPFWLCWLSFRPWPLSLPSTIKANDFECSSS